MKKDLRVHMSRVKRFRIDLAEIYDCKGSCTVF